MLKLVSDENFHGDVLRGLLRRLPAVDLVRVQDIGLMGADDPTILQWAAEADRVLLTHDEDTMPGFAYARVRRGEPMPGVLLVTMAMSKREAIEQLLIAIQCLETSDCENLVHHLPL